MLFCLFHVQDEAVSYKIVNGLVAMSGFASLPKMPHSNTFFSLLNVLCLTFTLQ